MASCSRRNLFKLAGAGSLALLLPVTTRFGDVMAQEQLDPSDAQAKALGYVHDTEEVDEAKWASHDVSQNCANCQFWIEPEGDSKMGGCQIVQGKIAPDAWCNLWAAA